MTVSVRREGADAVLEVADRGPGVPHEHARARLRALRPRRRRRGARAAAAASGWRSCGPSTDAHGGRVELRDAEGGGARFVVTLPAADATRSDCRRYRVGGAEASLPKPRRSSNREVVLRRRPSPALVIALIALFVSLSGVSYGVATGFIDSREIKNNEVRSLDIRNNEIRTSDLRNNEVRGIDIRNSTVQGRDIALNTVTGEDVREDTPRQGAERHCCADTRHATPTRVSDAEDHPATTMAEGAAAGHARDARPADALGPCTDARRAAHARRLTVSHDRGRLRAVGERTANADFDRRRTSTVADRLDDRRVHRRACARAYALDAGLRVGPGRQGASRGRDRASYRGWLGRRARAASTGHLAAAGLDLDDHRQDHRAPLAGARRRTRPRRRAGGPGAGRSRGSPPRPSARATRRPPRAARRRSRPTRPRTARRGR